MSASVWRKCNLKQFATIYSGTDYKHNKKGEEFPIIGTGGIMGYTGDFLNEGPAVLTGRKGTIDRPIYIEGKFWNVDTIFCIKPFDSTNVKYLYYALSNKNLLLLNEATGVPSVSSDNLYKQSFILPKDSEEQKHIADILSTCDTVIQKTQKTIDKCRARKQGMMQDLFTRGLTKDGKLRPSYKEAPELYKESELGMIPKEWEVKELKVLCNSIGDGLHGTPSYESNTELYFINGNNLDNGVINLSNAEEISEISYQKNKIDLSEKTLFLSINGTIGNVAFYNGEQILLGKSAAYINTRDINKYFLMYYIQTDYFSRYINKKIINISNPVSRKSVLDKVENNYEKI